MASEVDIANRALQMLGAKRIVSLTSDDSKNARACNTAYEPLRDAELRAHPWNFATTREQIAADASAPAFGRARSFTLPATCLRVLPPYPEEDLASLDWIVEGRQIYTNDAAPLNVRYTKIITDPNQMDALFREALAAKMAMEMCEEITQSNTKWEICEKRYKEAIAKAKKTNAIEKAARIPADDTWITCRS